MEIADYDGGMASSIIYKIFALYFTNKQDSTGLGLYRKL